MMYNGARDILWNLRAQNGLAAKESESAHREGQKPMGLFFLPSSDVRVTGRRVLKSSALSLSARVRGFGLLSAARGCRFFRAFSLSDICAGVFIQRCFNEASANDRGA